MHLDNSNALETILDGLERVWSNVQKYGELIIGIDQSYKNAGISIVADGTIRDIKSIRLERCSNNSEKRKVLRQRLDKLLRIATSKADHVVCIVERARVHGGQTSFINIDAIKAMGALTATIVDVCAIYGVAVFSVDTRCWKSQVVGTSKPQNNRFGVAPEKWPTVQWVIHSGFEGNILVQIDNPRKAKGTFVRNGIKYQYNDDAADSAGIAMFYCVGDRSKLKEEH